MVRDPICGMTIAEQDAYATRHMGGVQTHFCSAACLAQFDAQPQRFYPPPAGSSTAETAAVSRSVGQVHASTAGAWARALRRPIAFGLLAVLGLLTFYLGIITLAQGWGHAVQQLADDRNFIGAIGLGFGTQIGLYTYLRGLHTYAAAAGVTASTGTSTAAMLACCAHHLADILPIVGVAGVAAFLNAYKIPMLWLGIGMNLIGIIYLLRRISQHRDMTCHTPVPSGNAAS
jgi:YHS domain-containing protein